MKLATYSPKSAQHHQSGIGAVLDDKIIDLNYAYARYLREVEGEMRAYELASARIPRDMIGFLQGGEKAIDAAKRTIEFMKDKKKSGEQRNIRRTIIICPGRCKNTRAHFPSG